MGHITSVSADNKEGNSSSNDSRSLYRDSTLSYCWSRFEVTTTRTFSLTSFFICLAFNYRNLYCRG